MIYEFVKKGKDMYCTFCGKEIDDDQLFCPFCGKKVNETALAEEKTEPATGSEKGPISDAKPEPKGKPGKRNPKVLIIIGAIIAAAAIAGVAFALLGNDGNEQQAAAPSEKESEQNKDEKTTIFFASDYGEQYGWEKPVTTLSRLLNTVQSDGKNPEEIVMLGDYNSVEGKNNYNVDPADSIEEIRQTGQSNFPDLDSGDFIFVQGNVDQKSSSLSESGLHEFDNYYIYVLNTEKDFPWSEGKDKDSLDKVKAASEKMKECFEELTAQKKGKPVFVASHMPLHFTARTASKTGDNMYASLLFNVINEAGESLDIVYLYGHNCAKGWDCYLGGSSVYKAVGETLLVPDYKKGDVSTDKFTENTLTFTYLNGGYVGYYMNCSQDDLEKGLADQYSAADETLTCVVCDLYSDKIVLTRYDEDGIHPIGWDGEADPFDNYIDSDLIDSKYYSHKTESPQGIERKNQRAIEKETGEKETGGKEEKESKESEVPEDSVYNPGLCDSHAEDFLFPNSDDDNLSNELIFDVVEEDEDLVQRGINEIYARHGMIFEDSYYKNYYKNCEWYKPVYQRNEIKSSWFNQYENANIKALTNYRESIRDANSLVECVICGTKIKKMNAFVDGDDYYCGDCYVPDSSEGQEEVNE